MALSVSSMRCCSYFACCMLHAFALENLTSSSLAMAFYLRNSTASLASLHPILLPVVLIQDAKEYISSLDIAWQALRTEYQTDSSFLHRRQDCWTSTYFDTDILLLLLRLLGVLVAQAHSAANDTMQGSSRGDPIYSCLPIWAIRLT